MPLIIPLGGSRTITCEHDNAGAQYTKWYRGASLITEGIPGANGCSCEVPQFENSTTDAAKLIFSNFSESSMGEYSCRVQQGAFFNICRFDVIIAGEISIAS